MRAARFLVAPLALCLLAAGDADQPDPAALRASVETLAGFGTRHTASDTLSDTRGIGAARRWAANRLNAISDACDGCIEVANIARGFDGPAAPQGVQVVDVLGFQRGAASHRVVILLAHIDSRGDDPLDAAGDAPGAQDNASGVAAVLEAARILSREKFGATIIYAFTSGHAQGGWGADLLSRMAGAVNWDVAGVVDMDAVAGPDRPVILAQGDAGLALGARIRALAAAMPGAPDLEVVLAGDGWEHAPFAARGYPAVTLTTAPAGDGARTERAGDLPGGVDYARVAALAALDLAIVRSLAGSPPETK